MGRKFLLITTDQQRYDGLGCNGGQFAKTPVIDGFAESGIVYRQARNQCAVCMPARCTVLTGQYVGMHGVTSNGIPLPEDHPSVVHELKRHGYETALIGKAHFEPHATSDYFENIAARDNLLGPHRGFDHMELAGHTGRAGRSLFHYPKWLAETHPDAVAGFHEYTRDGHPSALGGGDTGAPQVANNPIDIEHYHTHWTARRTIDWLAGRDDNSDWMCWMSFPDPHHPWDVPNAAKARFEWRDLPLPPGYPGSREACEAVLRQKPWHWLAWYVGEAQLNFEVPPDYIPANTTAEQIREVNAVVHAKNELIDEAIGEVRDYLVTRGWDEDTDIIFTTDHGELQGDFGMLFKGPYHVNALTHVPLIWRPAPSAALPPAEIEDPVGHVDIAPTILSRAGIEVPDWMQGTALPTDPGTTARDRAFTEWRDIFDGNEIVMKTMAKSDVLVTVYESTNQYNGTEGELYLLREDPHQWHNLWDDSGHAVLRAELVEELRTHWPADRETPLEKVAQV
ncbi:MAG: sulfatase-like hydrolase/transferase [Hyphomicrobiaceae bacterium]